MEFNIINKYFTWEFNDKSVINSVGDDCAVIKNTKQLTISTDTFIEGVHFFKNTPAKLIAYKALAVNLSDLAAMGSKPKYFTLALTLPNLEHKWLQEFSNSLKKLAQEFDISLIGGDTTKGKLSITITVIGEGESLLRRSGAKVGDSIFVSGDLGGAKLALQQIKSKQKIKKNALKKLQKPLPRIELGVLLNSIATSCIDISDGLIADLSHILKQSKVGAEINSKQIPIFKGSNLEYALYGGDDYQLCFTANLKEVKHILDISKIGEITNGDNLRIDGEINTQSGYLHF